jgi:Cu/Zn superoxide dismutase
MIDFVPYTGYTGDLYVAGKIEVMADSEGTTMLTLKWDLMGLDPLCANGADPDTANSCGIHIHALGTCASAAGGHYYNEDVLDADPWGVIAYTSMDSKSNSMATVDAGFTPSELVGKSMIVHGYGGERIGCSLLTMGLGPGYAGVVPFVPYTGYTGGLQVAGHVTVIPMGEDQQHIYWDLSGLDPACASGPDPDTGNSCGIHVHELGTCEEAAGGHYYNTESGISDPWATVGYTAMVDSYDNKVSASGDHHVDTQIAFEMMLGKSIIVHGHDGGRIACAIILPKPCSNMCMMSGMDMDMDMDMDMGMDMGMGRRHQRKRNLLFGSTPMEPEPEPSMEPEPPVECGMPCEAGCEMTAMKMSMCGEMPIVTG